MSSEMTQLAWGGIFFQNPRECPTRILFEDNFRTQHLSYTIGQCVCSPINKSNYLTTRRNSSREEEDGIKIEKYSNNYSRKWLDSRPSKRYWRIKLEFEKKKKKRQRNLLDKLKYDDVVCRICASQERRSTILTNIMCVLCRNDRRSCSCFTPNFVSPSIAFKLLVVFYPISGYH